MTRGKCKEVLQALWRYKDCGYSENEIRESLDMAIKALEQEPCEDAVSRQALIERINNAEENFKADHMESIASDDGDAFVDGVLSGVFNIREMVAQAPSVTPKSVTVTDFADKCRECGRTAITRAENDEILNEAWSLLVSVTEEDGVTTAEANGMLKLMEFFFYKYHGLKKKPEWAENVEARIEREKVDRTIRTISELLPRDKEEDQEHESEEEENK